MSGQRPTRVGLVVGQLSTGGAEGQLCQLAHQIDRGRFELVVYCLSSQTEPVGTRLRDDGIAVRVVTGDSWVRLRRLAQVLDADRIDLAHAWLYIANAVAWGARWFGTVRPLITSARNCKVQGRVSQLTNALAFRASRAIVVNSLEVAQYIRRYYRAPHDRIHVVYNGVDTERFQPAGDSVSGAMGPIVTVGRMVEQKNHALFLRAAARLTGEVPDAHFVIVGDGPLRSMVEAQARSLGIAERVMFAGERPDVETILRRASLFWLTSRWEGLPNVVLEAMASGVPVIATDVGGTRELIRAGVDGFVVPSEDATGFVHHSATLLGDAAQRHRFAAAARQRAEVFSTRRMVTAMEALYATALTRL